MKLGYCTQACMRCLSEQISLLSLIRIGKVSVRPPISKRRKAVGLLRAERRADKLEATGETLIERICRRERLCGGGRDLSGGGPALARRQDHAAQSNAGARTELAGLMSNTKESPARL